MFLHIVIYEGTDDGTWVVVKNKQGVMARGKQNDNGCEWFKRSKDFCAIIKGNDTFLSSLIDSNVNLSWK